MKQTGPLYHQTFWAIYRLYLSSPARWHRAQVLVRASYLDGRYGRLIIGGNSFTAASLLPFLFKHYLQLDTRNAIEPLALRVDNTSHWGVRSDYVSLFALSASTLWYHNESFHKNFRNFSLSRVDISCLMDHPPANKGRTKKGCHRARFSLRFFLFFPLVEHSFK